MAAITSILIYTTYLDPIGTTDVTVSGSLSPSVIYASSSLVTTDTLLPAPIISVSSIISLPSNSSPTTAAVTSTTSTGLSSAPITSNESSATSKTATSATSASFTSTSSPSDSAISTHVPGASKGGLKSGAVAGVAIGTFLIGAIIAALAVFILMKRRSGTSGHHRKHSRSSGGSYGGDNEKRVGGPNEIILSENLLDRADDSQIKQQMVDLNEVIDQHCVNHYHLETVAASQGDWEKRLKDSGYSRLNNSGLNSTELGNLLQNPRSRSAAIHHLIALVILSHVDWRTGADVSLLPPQIAGFCRTIPPVEKQAGSQIVFDKAFSSWKQLSAFLIEPFRSNRESPKADRNELIAPIGRNVAQINTILAPFVKSGRNQEENLTAIIFGAAQLGLLLFSQPNEWAFLWEVAKEDPAVTASRKSSLVVFPALVEKVEKRGEVRNRVVVGVKQVNV